MRIASAHAARREANRAAQRCDMRGLLRLILQIAWDQMSCNAREISHFRSLKSGEVLQIPLTKAEGRNHGKEKHERHGHQSNAARGCTVAIPSTEVVRYGLTLMTHGVQQPP
jgi:hypothetical protein